MYTENKVKFDEYGRVIIERGEDVASKCPFNSYLCSNKCPLLIEYFDDDGNYYLKFCNGNSLPLVYDEMKE